MKKFLLVCLIASSILTFSTAVIASANFGESVIKAAGNFLESCRKSNTQPILATVTGERLTAPTEDEYVEYHRGRGTILVQYIREGNGWYVIFKTRDRNYTFESNVKVGSPISQALKIKGNRIKFRRNRMNNHGWRDEWGYGYVTERDGKVFEVGYESDFFNKGEFAIKLIPNLIKF